MKTFRTYFNPNSSLRAQIYRAVQLSPSVYIFLENNDVVLKGQEEEYLRHYQASEDLTFSPKECTCLNIDESYYYYRIINNFIQDQKITGLAYELLDHDKTFLYISLKQKVEQIERLWDEYLRGGVIYKISFHQKLVFEMLRTFKWDQQIKFEIKGDQIEGTFRSKTKKAITSQGQEEKVDYIEIPEIIQDYYEAIGIIQLVQEEVSPLIQTHRIYFKSPNKEKIKQIVDSYQGITLPREGIEIFSQEEFKSMSRFRQASLIKACSGNYYSIVDLYQSCISKDPLTRQPFDKDFLKKINLNLSLEQTLLPELLVTTLNEKISFYVKISSKKELFWTIPNAKLSLELTKVLVMKWTDGSLFNPRVRVTEEVDPYLIFSPKAIYLFEQKFERQKPDLWLFKQLKLWQDF